jgi:hypothetical protein
MTCVDFRRSGAACCAAGAQSVKPKPKYVDKAQKIYANRKSWEEGERKDCSTYDFAVGDSMKATPESQKMHMLS